MIAWRSAHVAFGDEDIAVGGDGDVGGFVEQARLRAGDAGLAQSHRDLAAGVEFVHRLAFAIILELGIADPEVALRIYGGAVREIKNARAPARQQLPVLAALENRRFAAADAGIIVAAVNDEDAAVRGDFDGGHGGPFALGRLRPIPDGAERVGEIVYGLEVRGGKQRGDRGRRRDDFQRHGAPHTSSRPILTMKYSARVEPTFFALWISLEPITPTSPGPNR